MADSAIGETEKRPICIVGAGLVGSMLAVVLQKQGFQVTVYERYPDMTTIPSLSRSINLIMTRRGLKAAELLGLKEEIIEKIGVPVYGRTMHQTDGSTCFQKYGREGDCNYSVSRYELNCFLIRKAQEAGVELHWNKPLKDVRYEADHVTLVFHEGADIHLPPNVPVIGGDGGPSPVRYSFRKCGASDFTEDILVQGYKEMIFPPSTETGDYCMNSKSLHIWPRRTHFLMGLADKQKSFTGTLYVDNSEWPRTKEACESFLKEHYTDAIPLLGGLNSACEQILSKPEGLLGTVRTERYFHPEGKAVLIGDSAHAIVPFFGQGCNCGFEDVVVFSQLLESEFGLYSSKDGANSSSSDKNNALESGAPTTSSQLKTIKKIQNLTFADYYKLFTKFHELRKPSADAIAELALENFVEMRDLVADEDFLKMKHIEATLENEFPDKFRSRYSMVCYGSAVDGNVTYKAALTIGTILKEMAKVLLEQVEQDLNAPYNYRDENAPEAQRAAVLARAPAILEKMIAPQIKELGMELTSIKH